MPRIRLLADLASSHGTAIDGAAIDGSPVYDVAPGSMVPIVLDAIGYVGTDSIAESTWDATSAVALSSRTISGSTVSCNAYIPDTWADDHGFRVRNTLTLNTGLIRRTTMWFRTRYRSEEAS